MSIKNVCLCTVFVAVLLSSASYGDINLLANPGFEAGNTSSWSNYYDYGSIDVVTSPVHSGSYAGRCYNRDYSWQGITQDLLGKMAIEQTYTISAWARTNSSTNSYLYMYIVKTDSSGTVYNYVGGASVSDNGWVELSGSYSLANVNGVITELYILFEGPDSGIDFFIDDANVYGPEGEMNLADFTWLRAAYFDIQYPSSWISWQSGSLRNAFQSAGYEILDANQLKTWMDARITGGEPSVVVFCQDIAPDTVVESMSSSCTLRQYLDAGGKIVWCGDIPMWMQGHSDGSITDWDHDGAYYILGFYAADGIWDSEDQVTFTSDGLNWGLTQAWASLRSTLTSGLTVLAQDDSGYAAAWVKHYVVGDSYRGFVRLYDHWDMPEFSDIRRAAEYFPFKATNPNPADGAVIVTLDPNITLGWTPGEDALSHDVYFGTDFNDVKNANTTDPNVYMGNYSVNSYDPCTLDFYKTYYWRIDEVINPGAAWKGDVWSLMIASSPNLPADGTINANIVYQTLEGFGASGAWYENYLANHPEKEDLYDILFDQLGLDIYRERNSYGYSNGRISDTAEIVAEAKQRNPNLKIMISSWSPPAYLKSNDNVREGTLKKDPNGNFMYDEFAQWWKDSLDYYADRGVVADYINIQNEPSFQTDEWETCEFSPDESNDFAGYNYAFEAVYSHLYSQFGSDMPKMLAPETAAITEAPGYIDYLFDLNEVYGYAHHLYDSSPDNPDGLIYYMEQLNNNYGDKPLFQTEFFKHIDPPQTYNHTDAMNLAILMHNCLTVEEISAYLYWELFWVSPKGLVTVDGSSYNINPVYYAFKHYAAFTDPGWQRVDASTNSPYLRISAFICPYNQRLSAVIINTYPYGDINLDLSFTGFTIADGDVYRTTQTQNCVLAGSYDGTGPVTLRAQSITTLELFDTDYFSPADPPTGLAATPVSEMVLLDWNDNNEVDFGGYNVYRSQTSGSGYSKINSTLLSDSNYIDGTVLPDMNYFYVVTAVDIFSHESGYSNEESVTTFDTTPPAAPTGLATSDGNETILLYWNNNTEEDVNGYNIYRSTTSGSGYIQLNGTILSNPEYTDNDVSNGTIYYYVVTAVDNFLNESEYSEQAAGMPRLPIIYTFAGVTEPNTSINAYACDVDVFPFYDNAANRNSMVEATDQQYVNISADNTAEWTIPTPSVGDELFVWIEMKINVPPDDISRIDLTFNGNTGSSGSITHAIYVMIAGADWTANSSWVQVGSDESIPGGTDTTMTRSITSDISTYIDGTGKIVWGVYETTSNQVMHINYLEVAIYALTNYPPAAPNNLVATAGNRAVSLDWDDNNEPDLAGYNVRRSTSQGGGYSQINVSLVADSNYVDNDVNNLTDYYYVVTAVDVDDSESGYSNEASATPDYQTCQDVHDANEGLLSDLSGDCYVDLWDLETIAAYWLYTNCSDFNDCGGADFKPPDGDVDFEDFGDFALNWMLCNNPGDTACIKNWWPTE